MLTILKTAALSAMIGVGALAVMPAPAQAQGGIHLSFGSGSHGTGVSFHFGQRGQHYQGRGQRWHRQQQARHCSPGDAVAKARRMGLRRAQVVGTGPRTIHVRGLTGNHRAARVTFARAPGCPVIR